MRHQKVASRYAKSLLDLAKERKELETAQADMELVRDVIRENRDLKLLLKSPIVNADKKINVLKALFEDKVGKLAYHFIEIVVDHGRESDLLEIAESYIIKAKAENNIYPAQVESAAPLNDDLRKKILELVAQIQPGTIELEEVINKDVIGGFVLRVGDQMVDASIISHLNELRREFTENPYISEI